ncbi:hypothetical protein [Actibacterium pelagium]|uniref:Lipoprotein n=1 Tax=Actibacterium pelagium TaxID=2029103 RepID=A0A917ABG8_9RHOB|nr:hypothetical protein [Actibacterium pelagium]GGE38158.1 hypothetical protein GCM10011517_02410 [Actibacterium pelagium]
MLRPFIAVAGLATLTACSVPSTVPQSASLTRDVVKIDFGNGYICTGAKAEALQTETGWKGQLQGCPQTYDYQVTLLPGNNPVRYILVEGVKALGGEELFAPIAKVEVIRPDGRIVAFNSPPELPEDDD